MGGVTTGLYQVSATGGVPQVVTTPAEGERGHLVPVPLRNGRGVLFTVWRGEMSSAQIAVYAHDTGDYRVLGDGSVAQFAPSGHLVFQSLDEGLAALSFNADTLLEATGVPVPVFGGVDGTILSRQYYLGDDGSLAYIPGEEGSDRSLVWVDQNGNEELIEAEVRPYGTWIFHATGGGSPWR